MPKIFALDMVLYVAQTIGALIIAAMLTRYYRVFQREHLRLWAGSFYALALYQASAAVALFLALQADSPFLIRSGATLVSQLAGYLNLAFAVAGTHAALSTSKKPDQWLRPLLIGACVIALVCTFAWFGQPDAGMQRMFIRVIARYAIGAVCFVGIGVALWHFQRRAGLGARLVAIAMALYGLQLLHVVAIYVWNLVYGHDVAWAAYIGLIDLMAELCIGFGLVIWLLEGEHHRAESADIALRRLRDFDPVTGFPNRGRLLADLPRLLQQSNQQTALLLLQMDQADVVTGTLGVVSFETVMAEVAMRMEQHSRPGWPRPSRLSDARLVQPIPRAGNTSELTAVANDLLASMRVPIYDSGQELALSASVGIAVSPQDADGAESLIVAAEAAAQSAHDLGGNRFQYYSAEMNTLALTRLGLQSELRQALLRGEMELHFQPLIGSDSERICGAEALIRWHHPTRGLLLPDMFVTEMNQLGLIEDLDRYALEHGCREACEWKQRYGSEISLSINVSTRSFQRSGFPNMVRTVLKATGLDPSRLELEIVESGAMNDPQRAIASLVRLREIGVRLALDDFGTGYSSLSYLRELPVDSLKIDRSFVDNVISSPRDAAIVAATITLAHSLGLDVVAEGVESAEQVAWFREHHADRMQGFYFSPPLDRTEMRRLLQSRDQLLARAPPSTA